MVAEAELGWPAHKVAVLLANPQADVAAFEAAGWRTLMTGGDDFVETLANVFAAGTGPTESEGAR